MLLDQCHIGVGGEQREDACILFSCDAPHNAFDSGPWGADGAREVVDAAREVRVEDPSTIIKGECRVEGVAINRNNHRCERKCDGTAGGEP